MIKAIERNMVRAEIISKDTSHLGGCQRTGKVSVSIFALVVFCTKNNIKIRTIL